MECLTNIGYSKLRIAFDTDKIKAPPVSPGRSLLTESGAFASASASTVQSHPHATPHVMNAGGPTSPAPFTPRTVKEYPYYHTSTTTTPITTANSTTLHNRTQSSSTLTHSTTNNTTTNFTLQSPVYHGAAVARGPTASTSSRGVNVANGTNGTNGAYGASLQPPDSARSPPVVIGDIAEPFWVQPMTENAVWCDPDELFLISVKRKITLTDKRMFWEMARALIDLPELSLASPNSRIRTVMDLTKVLQRPEYRILWIAEAAQFLPKTMATQLICAAYVAPEEVNGRHSGEFDR